MIAFVHIEKTAGMTMQQILRDSYRTDHCTVAPFTTNRQFFTAEDYKMLKRLYPRLKSIASHRVVAFTDLESVCPEVKYYTFFREPLARCASHYQYQLQKMGKTIAFEEWIKVEKYHNFQTHRIAGELNVQKAIDMIRDNFFFVGLMEHFDESLLLLQKKLQDPQFNIHYIRKNIASDNRIKNELLKDPAKRKLLEEANRLDLELYDYVIKERYPEEQRIYGPELAADLAKFKERNKSYHKNTSGWQDFLKRNLLYKPALKLANIFLRK